MGIALPTVALRQNLCSHIIGCKYTKIMSYIFEIKRRVYERLPGMATGDRKIIQQVNKSLLH